MRSTGILSMDVGTSAMKAAIIGPRGELLWSGDQSLPTGTHKHRDWDPAYWTQALFALLKAAAAEAARQAIVVEGLAISGHGPSLVALDAGRRALGHALLWLDGRSEALPGAQSYYLPKVNWWRTHRRELWERTRHFVSVPEWLSHELCGELATVSPHGQFDPYIWTPGEIARYGLDGSLFPPMVAPGERIGGLSPAAAAGCGLPPGLPVFAAGSDFLMSLAGTGTIQPGRTCDRAGSSEGINHCSERPLPDSGLRLLPHLVQGYWNLAGILPATGLLFEWFRTLTGMDRLGYHQTLEAIRALPIRGNLPFFRSAPGKSALEFDEASFCGLRLEHEAIHLARAVVESIGFAVRGRLDAMEDAGCAFDEIRLCGGQAKNRPWVQMKADITGRLLAVPRITDAELLGNAVMAMRGLGFYGSLEEAVEAMVHIEQRVEPDPAAHRDWSERLAEFKERTASA